MNCNLVASPYGLMVIPQNDTSQGGPLSSTGLPADYEDVEFVRALLLRRDERGSALDVGSCLGTWTLALSGLPCVTEVHSFEPQRRLHQCIRGSIALNGISNAFCHHSAVGNVNGRIPVPQFDYRLPTSFGSIEFTDEQKQDLGQPRLPDSDETVAICRLDDFTGAGAGGPVIFIKIDVEGMEMDVLNGASRLIQMDRPLLFVEFIKTDKEALRKQIVEMGYLIEERFSDFLCRPL